MGEAIKSNGRTVTVVDWHANRLVDALVQQAAAQHRSPGDATVVVRTAMAALENEAAMLGIVCHAASNYTTVRHDANGKLVTSKLHDSAPLRRVPTQLPKRARVVHAVAPPALSSELPVNSLTDSAPASSDDSEPGAVPKPINPWA